MELTVYRQASKTRPDGTVVYKGEDALPYTDGQLFMTADGLGGAAAIRHTKFLPELFNEDKTAEVLFGGVYDDLEAGVFADYIKRSFFELYAVKDCYTDNVNNIKKSGYFASRIVSAIVLHEVLEKGAENWFKRLDEAPDVNDELDKMGGEFAELIRTNLCKAADNSNIIYESSYAGMALLGTTLCAGIFREKADSVEVIIITAGDSRPYIWTEVDGLQQLIADEERPDGGMTNYIKANEDAEFSISCHRFEVGKPCVLFSATDGCFDSSAFLSPMAFEKLILTAAEESDDTEAMSKYLYDFFLDNGRHDDSSTIAMKLFGWSDFASFRASAAKRLAYIEEEYVAHLDGLLTEDYIGMLRSGDDIRTRQLMAVRDSLRDSAEIKEWCRNSVKEVAEEAVKKLDTDELTAARRSDSANTVLLKGLVEDNFAGFAGLSIEPDRLSELLKTAESLSATSEEYSRAISEHAEKTARCSEELSELFERLKALGGPSDLSDFDEIGLNRLDDFKTTIDASMDALKRLTTESDEVKEFSSKSRQYIDDCHELAEEYPAEAEKLIDRLIDGELSEGDMCLVTCTAEDLAAVVDNIREARADVNELESEALESIITSEAEKLWQRDYAKIINDIESGTGDYSDSLREQVLASLKENSPEGDSLADKAAEQKRIFDEYYKIYSRYMGGEE